MNRVQRLAAVALALPGLMASVLFASPAHALDGASIRFVDTTAVTADYGDDWSTTLVVEYGFPDRPTVRADPRLGTVDVYLSGAVLVTGLPIQPDGLVYVSQPMDQPLLAPGAYQLSAVLNPAAGTGFAQAQTSTSLDLVIVGLGATATVTVDTVADGGVPLLTASLSGPYVDKEGGSPAGTWTFTVDSAKGNRVFETAVAQEQGSNAPVLVEITSKLTSGTEYRVATTFQPAAVLAVGLTVDPVEQVTFTTPEGTLGEALTAPVSLPGWLIIAFAVILAALVAGVIVVSVRRRRLSARAEPSHPSDDSDGPDTKD